MGKEPLELWRTRSTQMLCPVEVALGCSFPSCKAADSYQVLDPFTGMQNLA